MHRVDGSLWNVLDPVQAVQWDEEEPKPCKREQEPNIVLRRTIVCMRKLTLRDLVQNTTYLVRVRHQKRISTRTAHKFLRGQRLVSRVR